MQIPQSLAARRGGWGRRLSHKTAGVSAFVSGVKMHGSICVVALVVLGAAVCGKWSRKGRLPPAPPGQTHSKLLRECDLSFLELAFLSTART